MINKADLVNRYITLPEKNREYIFFTSTRKFINNDYVEPVSTHYKKLTSYRL